MWAIKKARQEETDWHTTRLSFRFIDNGQQFFKTDQRDLFLSHQHFLILNQWQEYKTAFTERSPANVYTIAFKKGLAEEMYQSLFQSAEYLLDNPFLSFSALTFSNSLHKWDREVKRIINKLIFNFEAGNYDSLGIFYDKLLEKIIAIQYDSIKAVANIKGIKFSTRVEVFKRLSVAKDYIESNYRKPILIEELAAISCLSVSYLKKSFGQVFNITPHQLIIKRRLEFAEYLIVQNELPIQDICRLTGFENISSFIRLFSNRYKVTPHQFRQLA